MRIVCDSSAMIWCGKLGLLRYLEKLCEVIVIPKGVEQEFQTGLKIGYRDAYQRMSFIQSQKVKNKTANKRIVESLQKKYGFSPCDAEVLAIAKQGYLVMSDDQHIHFCFLCQKCRLCLHFCIHLPRHAQLPISFANH